MIAEVSDDPLIGATVAHYTIESLAGEGGMGRVYRAHHSRLAHRRVALKVLLGDLAATMSTRLRFTQEAESASRLDHPNCVSVIDFGRTERGLLYLAMDFVEGRALSALIDEGPMEPARVIALSRQLAEGLEHAHTLGLVHRDLKPDNILVTAGPAGELPRIVDFGLAISPDQVGDAPRLTTIGIAVGTPTYASPEQTHGLAIDHRADLFALGVTMFEMLAGTVPYGGTIAEVVHRNGEGNIPAIASRAAGVNVPPGLEALVRRLMAPSPDARPQTARDVIAELDRIEADPASVVELAAPVAEVPAVERGHRWRRAVALLAVTAAVVLLAVALIRVEPTTGEPAAVAQPAPLDADIVGADAGAGIAHTDVSDAGVSDATEVASGAEPIEPIADSTRPAGRRPRPPARDVPDPPAADSSATVPEPRREANDAGVPARNDAPVPERAAVAPTTPAVVPPPPVVTVPSGPRNARVTYEQVEVRGALTRASVVRALERTTVGVRACYAPAAATAKRAPALALGAALVIDEYGAARDVRVADARLATLSSCVSTVLASTRADAVPDVGTVSVRFVVRFTPEVP